MEVNKVYNEPCLETLKKMEDKSIDCVITSPPYWQLRDYGYEGQWGLEPTYQEYLEHLWEMMDEIYRVLKDEGTCWINLGDTYARGSRAKYAHSNESLRSKHEQLIEPNTKPNYEGLDKCLLLIPHRFAIGCIDRGWIVRNDIIWAKRNGMPESVSDRFTKKHEYIFFMVKSEKYYFDLDAIRDRVKDESLKRYEYDFSGNKGGVDRDKFGYSEGSKKHLIPNSKYENIDIEKKHRQGMNKERGNGVVEKRPNLPSQHEFVTFLRNRIRLEVLASSIDLPKTKIEHWFRKDEDGFSYPSFDDWNMVKDFIDNWDEEFYLIDEKMSYVEYETDDINKNIAKGKNPGSVSDFWDITTKPSSNKHYAAYNDELIRKPILAGCPEIGIIYDPFMGTGSTAEASLRANRRFIGSEMSEEYIKICNQRLSPILSQLTLF